MVGMVRRVLILEGRKRKYDLFIRVVSRVFLVHAFTTSRLPHYSGHQNSRHDRDGVDEGGRESRWEKKRAILLQSPVQDRRTDERVCDARW
jgi:hypothetical protein